MRNCWDISVYGGNVVFGERHPDVHNQSIIHLSFMALESTGCHLGPLLPIDPIIHQRCIMDDL